MKAKVILMAAAIAICSCAKMEEKATLQEGEMVDLSFRVPSQPMTKMSGEVVEDAVQDLQVFVFTENGTLDAYGHAEANEITLTCRTGTKRIYAIVNAPTVNYLGDENAIMEHVSLFGENSSGKLVMAGMATETIEKNSEIVIPVSRLISKVVLKSVKNNFETPQHREMNFAIKSIFLTNAPKDKAFFKTPFTPTAWYNKNADLQTITQSGDMLYEAFTPTSVSYSKTKEFGNFLYCYPNTAQDGPNPTYLVVQAILEGKLCYYPVKLPSMESNKCYNVYLTVCRPGSEDHNVAVEKGDALFSVDVQGWSEEDVNDTI